MPRPFPWLPRLSEIRRTVANSVKSHHSRRDLELLFKISSRAAGRLLELLATESMTNAHLVSREVLTTFLAQVAESDDVAGLCEEIRQQRTNLSRAKQRFLVPREFLQTTVRALPETIRLEPGCLTIRFDSIEDMMANLIQLLCAMNDDPLAIEAQCEPARKTAYSAEAEDGRCFDEELEWLKTETEAYLAREGEVGFDSKKERALLRQKHEQWLAKQAEARRTREEQAGVGTIA